MVERGVSREVALAGGEGDGAFAAQVAHGDLAALDGGERAVAAVGGDPDRAPDGRGGVAPAGAEAALRAGAQAPDRAPRELRGVGPGRRGCAAGAAAAESQSPSGAARSARAAQRARDCNTWNNPALKRPDCVLEPEPVALTSSTVPRLVSKNDPTGTCRSAVNGTNASPF